MFKTQASKATAVKGVALLPNIIRPEGTPAIEGSRIRWFAPDLPSAQQLHPYLLAMQNTGVYSNFGPLHQELTARIQNRFDHFDADNGWLTLTSSGTMALEVALASLELPKGANVAIPTYTFPATLNVAIRAGFNPLLVEVDERDLLLDLSALESVAAKREVSAILLVASLGQVFPESYLLELVKKFDCPIVVDAAASIHAQTILDELTYCFSLHATKPFGVGEGGAIWSTDPKITSFCREFLNFGRGEKTFNPLGTNGKLDELSCAMGLAQLDRWDTVASKAEVVKTELLDILNPLETSGAGTLVGRKNGAVSLVVRFKEPLLADICKAIFQELNIELRDPYEGGLLTYCDLSSVAIEEYCSRESFYEVKDSLVGFPFHNHLSSCELMRIREGVSTLLEEIS